MRLTYTIELDVKRYEGANIRKEKVSEAIMETLFEVFDGGETFVARTGKGDDHAWMEVKELVVFPHDDSRPAKGFEEGEVAVPAGDPCPTCKITQFKRGARAKA